MLTQVLPCAMGMDYTKNDKNTEHVYTYIPGLLVCCAALCCMKDVSRLRVRH